MKPIRVLVAKPGLDGHDRGAKIVAKAFRDAGMEVIYTGLHQTSEMIVRSAIDEDVDVIGLSILSGAHNKLVPELMALLKIEAAEDIMVIVGGVIPSEDFEPLKALGIAQIFTPGSSLEGITTFIQKSILAKRAKI